MIKNIVFDFGGVLIDWNPRYLYRQIFSNEAEMEMFLRDVCPMSWNLTLDIGKPFAEGVKERQALYPQYIREIEMYDSRWIEMIHGSIPENVELLKELQAKGYPTYGLSNWSEEKFSQVYPRFDFLHHFEGMVISGYEHALKPEPLLYQILLKRYSLQAEECVFIDDNPDNIATAARLGFATILCQNPTQVRVELEAIL